MDIERLTKQWDNHESYINQRTGTICDLVSEHQRLEEDLTNGSTSILRGVHERMLAEVSKQGQDVLGQCSKSAELKFTSMRDDILALTANSREVQTAWVSAEEKCASLRAVNQQIMEDFGTIAHQFGMAPPSAKRMSPSPAAGLGNQSADAKDPYWREGIQSHRSSRQEMNS